MPNRAQTESAVTGRAKVLVIAHPELALAIYEALEPYALFPAREAQVGAPASKKKTPTVSLLFSQIFPGPTVSPQPGVLARMLGALKGWPRHHNAAQKSGPATDSSSSLFQWGDYDFVIIQDLWLAASGPYPTLECAGYVLANLDYYLWGNFGTKKIILVTDEDFLAQKGEWNRRGLASPPPTQSMTSILHGFDQKEAFELIALHGKEASPVKRLIQVIKTGASRSHGPQQVDATHHNGSAVVDALMHPIMEEAVRALRAYVNEHAEIVIVDDEYKELSKTFADVTGRQLADPQDRQAGEVSVARASEGVAHQVKSFANLVELCADESQADIGGRKRYTLFVTDILFKGPTWHQTGLDLIEKLRQQLNQLDETRRVGIVAYTSFTTPFITMSSYQRGADFVVFKEARGAHDIKTSNTDRLLMTLAYLCFQKSFLLEKRREAGELISQSVSAFQGRKKNSESLSQLRAVLPKYAVSLHLQQEWLDTCYLFEAIDVYGPSSNKLKLIHDEVSSKYD